MSLEQAHVAEQSAFSVNQFCVRNSISRQFFYKLIKQGRGPRFMLLGTRRLVTREAEMEWHKRMEAEAVAAA